MPKKSKISVAKVDHLMPFEHHSMKCNSQHAVHAKMYFLLQHIAVIQSNLPVIRVKKKNTSLVWDVPLLLL